MTFRGRTVVFLVAIAVLAGSLMTYTITNTFGTNAGKEAAETNNGDPGQTVPDATTPEDEKMNDHLKRIASAIDLIQRRYYEDVDEETLVTGAINGILSSLNDPHSVYMDPEQAERFQESVISSTFSGIGAEVTMRTGKVMVVSPIKGSPAEAAGILPNDVILAINGESLEGLTLNEAVAKIRGPKGSKAKLNIQRGTGKPIEIEVIRDDIEIETVHAEMLQDGIGLIQVYRFSEVTEEQFFTLLDELETEGLDGLIIDLRNNPGGLLQGVENMVMPFIPAGKTIVQTVDSNGETKKTVSTGEGKPYDIVVLTNNGSASASEIFAASIQQNDVGIVVGERTYGKGTVQSTFSVGMNDYSNIKLTIAKWLTPDGSLIEGKGVEPDVIVELPELYRVAPLSREQTLRQDDNNEEVKKVQIMLTGLGYETDRQDGYFSEQTKQSVESFQREHGLPITGQVDEATADMLEEQIVDYLMKKENDVQLNKAIELITASKSD